MFCKCIFKKKRVSLFISTYVKKHQITPKKVNAIVYTYSKRVLFSDDIHLINWKKKLKDKFRWQSHLSTCIDHFLKSIEEQDTLYISIDSRLLELKESAMWKKRPYGWAGKQNKQKAIKL